MLNFDNSITISIVNEDLKKSGLDDEIITAGTTNENTKKDRILDFVNQDKTINIKGLIQKLESRNLDQREHDFEMTKLQIQLAVLPLFETGDIVELATYVNIDSVLKKGCSCIGVDPNDMILEDFIMSMGYSNAHGAHIFFGINPRRPEWRKKRKEDGSPRCARNEDVLMARCLAADFDHMTVEQAETRRVAAGLPLPSLIVNSGHGVHEYWRMKEPITDMELWSNYQARLSMALGSDPAIKDPKRYLRLPGFFNTKAPKAFCDVVMTTSERWYDISEIQLPDKPMRTRSTCEVLSINRFRGSEEEGKDKYSRSTKYFVESGAPEGERNQALFKAAADMAGCGTPIEEASDLLTGAALSSGLRMDEIGGTIRSAYSKPRTPTLSQFPLKEIIEWDRNEQEGDARLFVEQFLGQMVFDHAAGKWYIWNEHYWIEDRENSALTKLQAVVDFYRKICEEVSMVRIDSISKSDKAQADEAEKALKILIQKIRKLQKVAWREDVLILAAAGKDRLGITGEEWDRNPWLLGFKNGVMDLQTGKIRAGMPTDYIKTIVPHDWEEIKTPAPEWEKFLLSVFDEDQEMVDYLQRWFGYSITGTTKEHILPIFYGIGRNGKGTILEIIGHVLGDLAGPIRGVLSAKLLERKGFPG